VADQRYVLHCPHCGRVPGVAPVADPDDTSDASSDDVIDEQTFESSGGPVTRVRCPRCGRWVNSDLAEPE
jgi:hypothetical protein